MNILFIMVPASIALGLFFLIGFYWALKSDQFEDLETPALRILDNAEQEE